MGAEISEGQNFLGVILGQKMHKIAYNRPMSGARWGGGKQG